MVCAPNKHKCIRCRNKYKDRIEWFGVSFVLYSNSLSTEQCNALLPLSTAAVEFSKKGRNIYLTLHKYTKIIQKLIDNTHCQPISNPDKGL